MTKQKRLPPLWACVKCQEYPQDWYTNGGFRFQCPMCGFSIIQPASKQEAAEMWNKEQKERAKT